MWSEKILEELVGEEILLWPVLQNTIDCRGLGKVISCGENSPCKGPGAGLYLACWKQAARKPVWSRVNEGEREREGAQGRLCRALWAL